VVFADIDLPGHSPSYTPADDNGWTSVYTSPCSGVVKRSLVPAAVDRADLNGFAGYLTGHSAHRIGVYSAPDIWTSIVGTGSAASIPNTYEWTYESFTASLAHRPYGWCLSGTSTCARASWWAEPRLEVRLDVAVVRRRWQRNGYGDVDQIDAARTP